MTAMVKCPWCCREVTEYNWRGVQTLPTHGDSETVCPGSDRFVTIRVEFGANGQETGRYLVSPSGWTDVSWTCVAFDGQRLTPKPQDQSGDVLCDALGDLASGLDTIGAERGADLVRAAVGRLDAYGGWFKRFDDLYQSAHVSPGQG